MVCPECQGGSYNHCTCYLHGEFGIDPAHGSMWAADWFGQCDLYSPPSDSTYYLLACDHHVAIRKGNTYYYHPGSEGAAPKTKAHSTAFEPDWVGCTGTVKYMRLD